MRLEFRIDVGSLASKHQQRVPELSEFQVLESGLALGL